MNFLSHTTGWNLTLIYEFIVLYLIFERLFKKMIKVNDVLKNLEFMKLSVLSMQVYLTISLFVSKRV